MAGQTGGAFKALTRGGITLTGAKMAKHPKEGSKADIREDIRTAVKAGMVRKPSKGGGKKGK